MDTPIVQASGKFAHCKWLALDGQGKMATECAILKTDKVGNISFIRLKDLDSVDRQRMFDILTSRNAGAYELWDIMMNRTLGNGMNALVYFHQYAKVVSPKGEIYTAKSGQIGIPSLVKTADVPAATEAASTEPKAPPKVPKSTAK